MIIPDYKPKSVESLGRPDPRAAAESEMAKARAVTRIADATRTINKKERQFALKQSSLAYDKELNEFTRENEGKMFYSADDIPVEILEQNEDLRRRAEEAMIDDDGTTLADIPRSAVYPHLMKAKQQEMIERYGQGINNKNDRRDWSQAAFNKMDADFTDAYVRGVAEMEEHYRQIDREDIAQAIQDNDFDRADQLIGQFSGSAEERRELQKNKDYFEERSLYLDAANEDDIIKIYEALGILKDDSQKYLDGGGTFTDDQRYAMIQMLESHLSGLEKDSRAGRSAELKKLEDRLIKVTNGQNSGEKYDLDDLQNLNMLAAINAEDINPVTLERYEMSHIAYRFSRVLVDMPMDMRQDIVNLMDQEPAEFWKEIEDSPRMAAIFDNVTEAYKKDIFERIRDINKVWTTLQQEDTVGFAQKAQLPGADLTPIVWRGADGGINPELGLHLAKRLEDYQVLTQRLGTDTGMLSQTEAEQFADFFESELVDTTSKVDFLQVVQNELGDESPAFYQKLSKSIPSYYMTAAELENKGDTVSSMAVLKGAQLRQREGFEIKDERNRTMDAYNYLAGSFSANPTRNNRIVSAAIDYAVYNAERNGRFKGNITREDIQAGIDSVTNGIIRHKGVAIEAPVKGMTSSQFSSWLNDLTPDFWDTMGSPVIQDKTTGLNDVIRGSTIKQYIDNGTLEIVSVANNTYALRQAGMFEDRYLADNDSGGQAYLFQFTPDAETYTKTKEAEEALRQQNIIDRAEERKQRIELERKDALRRMKSGLTRLPKELRYLPEDDPRVQEALEQLRDREDEEAAERAQKLTDVGLSEVDATNRDIQIATNYNLNRESRRNRMVTI